MFTTKSFPFSEPAISAFLDAISIRALGAGLCVEAGTEKENFPFFREFWLDVLQTSGNCTTIYALLDGQAATGAFRFDLTPGQETTLDVQATLFPRRAESNSALRL